MNAKIKLVIAGDQTMYRELVCSFLEKKGFSVLGAATTVPELIEQSITEAPDIAILFVKEPQSAKAMLQSISNAWPGIRLLLMMMSDSRESAIEYIAEGVSGCFFMNEISEALVKTIKCIHEKGSDYNNIPMQHLLEEFRRKKDLKSTMPVFNQRQNEILPLVCNGMTYKQMADNLSVSEKTIEHHIRVIFQKTGCKSRTELLKYSVKNRLVSL